MRCLSCGREHQSTTGACPFCGTAMDELPSGVVIGEKWRIERLLGYGGMGRVYLARHHTLNRPMAVKVLHQHYAASRSIIKRFRAEALAASRLEHPNVVSIVDYGTDSSGLLYIAMEFLRGRSLEALAADPEPPSEERVVRIAIQILRALEVAHDNGIIHRDLKPENVMVNEESDPPDAVKVLDFGLAKALDPGILDGMSRITMAGSTCGTPEYMSPEQAQGLDLDARSDIYALGVLLFRVLAGSPPFTGNNPVAVARAHVIDPPPPMEQFRPGLKVSPAFKRVIERCLAKAPADRFESALAMRHHLEQMLPSYAQTKDRAATEPDAVDDFLSAGRGPTPPPSMVTPPASDVQLPWVDTPPPASSSKPKPVLLTGGSLSSQVAERVPAAKPSPALQATERMPAPPPRAARERAPAKAPGPTAPGEAAAARPTSAPREAPPSPPMDPGDKRSGPPIWLLLVLALLLGMGVAAGVWWALSWG